jgi:hypothetical protein
MKQINMFGELSSGEDNNYTKKIQAPIYEPKNQQPHIISLIDKEKTHRLIREIETANISYDEKMFLMDAARRHNVFNYERIADYYAHATPEMQNLMERSALVIIDFEKAIQLNYVKVCEDIKQMYLTEYDNEQE